MLLLMESAQKKLITDKKNVVGLNVVSSDESQSSDIKKNIQDIEEKPKKKSSYFSYLYLKEYPT